MKKLFLILSVLLSLAFVVPELSRESFEVEVAKDSEVSISGTTNINSFNCCYNVNALKNPIPVCFEWDGVTMVFQSTVLKLENKCFDCGHKGINKDFNKLLKTEVYPNIRLELKEIKKNQGIEKIFNAKVKIYIADKNNTYNIPVVVSQNGDYYIEGDLHLNLADFDLHAPKKLLGLIEVHDEIKVTFGLHLKRI